MAALTALTLDKFVVSCRRAQNINENCGFFVKITLHLLANKAIVWQIYEKQLKRDLFKVIVGQVYNAVEKDIKMF